MRRLSVPGVALSRSPGSSFLDITRVLMQPSAA